MGHFWLQFDTLLYHYTFMLSYSEVTTGKVIVFNNEPCKVLSHHVFRMQQRKPVNATKLKGIKTGKMIEYSFHQNENVEEAALEKKPIVFIYESKGEYWFHADGKPGERFALSAELVGTKDKFLRPKDIYEALVFEEEIIDLEIPVKMELRVTEAAPAVKGNTAQGASKMITLETGVTVTAPLFINTGDVIIINTETGDYVGRAEKK